MGVRSWLETLVTIDDGSHSRKRKRRGSRGRYSRYDDDDDYEYDYSGFGFGGYRKRQRTKSEEKDDGKHTFILEIPGWEGYLTKRMTLEECNRYLARNKNILAEKVLDSKSPGARMGDGSRMGRAVAKAAGRAFGKVDKEE